MYQTHPSALAALDLAHEQVRRLWEPPPDITVSQWAEANRVMPRGTTSRPGPFRAEKFQREMMDVFCDPLVHKIAVMKGTQIGYTDAVLNNLIGYTIDLDPKPIMMVLPGGDVVREYARKRLNPMVEATPCLRSKVKEAKSRDGGNTLKMKTFPGGFIKLANAGSGKDLRSDPIPLLLFDEVDGYEDDVGGEGDPLQIGERRTDQYPDAKILYGSTPAKPKGFSKIEDLYERSDKRRFHVPCPYCGHMQVLRWRDQKTNVYRLTWEKDVEGYPIPETVRFMCNGCGVGIAEHFKQRMLDSGEWLAECPGREIVGFHINALYSPWKENWAILAKEWHEAQGNQEKLRAFINLRLGETFEESGDRLEAEGLGTRLEEWPEDIIPHDVAVLTAQADVQGNRIEATIEGWAAGEQSYLIHREVFWGDPSTDPGVWEQLEEFRLREWKHSCGAILRPIILVVDSGDQTDAVYDYVLPRQNIRDRVFAIKGVDFHAKPVLVQDGASKRHAIRLFTVATHAAKERIFSRLKMNKPEPGQPYPQGWIHLPTHLANEEYLAQLTSEKKLTVTDKKTRARKVVWVKTHTRNEALDLKVYALAALFILQNHIDPVTFRDLGALAAAIRGEVPLAGRRTRGMRSQAGG
jgi:phage terminase large subunit GpA-like protein